MRAPVKSGAITVLDSTSDWHSAEIRRFPDLEFFNRIEPKAVIRSQHRNGSTRRNGPCSRRSVREPFEMKLKRWQLIWTLLNALWLAAWTSPMAILWLEGDTEQLSIYFGMWVAIALIPTVAVYVVGLFFGMCVMRANRNYDNSRTTSRRTVWLLAFVGWALLVGIFCVMSRSPINPFQRFAGPLAAAIVLLIVILPPMVFCAAGLMIDRIRRNVRKG